MPEHDSSQNENELPKNISIQLNTGTEKRFFDRHFGAVVGLLGVIGAAITAAVIENNLSKTFEEPKLALVTKNPVSGKPVRFTVTELSDYAYDLIVVRQYLSLIHI